MAVVAQRFGGLVTKPSGSENYSDSFGHWLLHMELASYQGTVGEMVFLAAISP
ncbi:hypothetical protein [Desulfocastanea catecholica]